MEYQEKFKFLKIEQMKRKDKEEYFFVIHLLDKQNTPCRFFIFNKDLMKKVSTMKFAGLQDLNIIFRVAYSNNTWQVTLLDIN